MPTLKVSTKCRTSTPKPKQITSSGSGRADHVSADLVLLDNLIGFGMGPKKGPDGKLAFVLPMGNKKLPGIAVEDIGKCALGIFKRSELIGKTVGVAASISQAARWPPRSAMRWNSQSPTTRFRRRLPRLRLSWADDLGNMFQFKAETESAYCGPGTSRSARAQSRTPDIRQVVVPQQVADTARVARFLWFESKSIPQRS